MISLFLSRLNPKVGHNIMGEKTPDHPQAELGLFQVTRAGLEPTPVSWQAL